MRRLLSEPTVHFFVLGSLIFAGHMVFRNDADAEHRDRIVVDGNTVDQIVEQFRRRHERPPSADEKRAAVREWVRREMLVREAIDSGLHRVDPIVRRRLAQAMKFGAGGRSQPSKPAEKRLAAYYRENRERYRRPARFTFRHVYLRDCTGNGDARCPKESRKVLRALRDGASPDRFGAPFVHGRRFTKTSAEDAADMFGPQFARRLKSLPVGEWAGPVQSGLGVHLVRVAERAPAEVPPLEEVRAEVRQDLRNDLDETPADRAIEHIRDDYRLDVRVDMKLGAVQ